MDGTWREEATLKPTRVETEVSEECVATRRAQWTEGKSLVFLQANCKSILNKTVEF
jgi:hypothetical protein